MYADRMSDAMKEAIDETAHRRSVQEAYNKEHGITPTSIKKAVRELISISKKAEPGTKLIENDVESMSANELKALKESLNRKMLAAAAELNFELAAEYRDKLAELKKIK